METIHLSPWLVYLLTRLDSLKEALGFLACMFTVLLLVAIVIYLVTSIAGATDKGGYCYDKDARNTAKVLRKTLFWLVPTWLIFATLSIGLPTTKQMAAIIVLPPLVNTTLNNEELRKLPNNLLELTNEWIEELKPNKDGPTSE